MVFNSSHPVLGGIFPLQLTNGTVDVSQQENLLAFLLAVSQINNKTDGIFDDILPSVSLSVFVRDLGGQIGVAQSSFDVSSCEGCFAAVYGLSDHNALFASQVLEDTGIFQSLSVASDSSLGQKTSFPHHSMVNPLDTFQVSALQDVLCNYFNYRDIAVVSSHDLFGVLGNSALLDERFCSFNIISSLVMRPNVVIEDFVDLLKISKVQTIVLLTNPSDTVEFMMMANDHDLLKGRHIFYQYPGNSLVDFAALSSRMSLKSVFSMQYSPDFLFANQSSSWQFLDSWVSGAISCAINGPGVFDLLSSDLIMLSNSSVCSSLNITGYLNGSLPNPYAAYVYDSTLMMALGLDSMMQQDIPMNSSNFMNLLSSEINFEGATGNVSLISGDANTDFYGKGSRETDCYYHLMEYKSQSDAFEPVKVWSLNTGVVDCSECQVIDSFNLRPPLFNQDLPPSFLSIALALGGIVVFGSLILYALLGIFFKEKVIKVAHPELLAVIILGFLLSGIHIFILSMNPTDEMCIGALWTFHLPFALVFGMFYVKLWRVFVIVNNNTDEKIKISSLDMFIRFSIFMGGFIILLLVVTFGGHPHANSRTVNIDQQTACTFDIGGLQELLLALEALFLVFVGWYAWQVRDVPDAGNESQAIGMITFFLGATACVFFPIIGSIKFSPNVFTMMEIYFFFVITTFALMMLFYPKFSRIFVAGGGQSNDEKIHPMLDIDGEKLEVEEALVLNTDILKKLTTREKLKMCQEQVKRWRIIMMDVSEAVSASSQEYAI